MKEYNNIRQQQKALCTHLSSAKSFESAQLTTASPATVLRPHFHLSALLVLAVTAFRQIG